MSRGCALVVLSVALAACGRQRMDVQPKYSPDEASARFPHAQSALPRVAGTVPVDAGDDAPPRRTLALLERGRERYGIYCEPCHGAAGHGDGPIVAKFIKPPDLTADQARGYSDGYLYAMIANGRALMPPYGDKVRGDDRWNVVNYVRAVIQAEQQ